MSNDQEIYLGATESPSAEEYVLDVTDFTVSTDKPSRAVSTPAVSGEQGFNSQNLVTVFADLNIPVDMTSEELFDLAVSSMNTAVFQGIRSGVAFFAVQESLKNIDCDMSQSVKPDTFKSWILAHKLSEFRVYEAIRMAKTYVSLPPEVRKSYISMGKVKALKFASLSPEVIKDIAENSPEVMDEMAFMSRKELAAKIKNLEAVVEIERGKSQRMSAALTSAKKRTTTYLLRTEEIREECMAFQYGCELNSNSLRSLFDEVNTDDRSLPEWRVQMEQVWVTAHAIAAQALDMLAYMKDHVQVGDMPERVTAQHILSVEESERWLLEAPMIKNEYEARKAMRAEKRDMAKPKGPGRPKKADGE